MHTEYPQHGEKVHELLKGLEVDRAAIQKLCMAVLGGNEAPLYPLDLLAFGAVKRNISSASAMRLMIDSWNMTCARTLLRTHIDTALRFSAAWLVELPHDFATKVVGGEQINRMHDRNGKRMTDAHLVSIRSKEYDWLPRVYESLSGYVHFSSSHFFDTVTSVGKEDYTFELETTDVDSKYPESSWIEILQCFREATEFLAKYLHGYATTKRMSPEQLERAKGDG